MKVVSSFACAMLLAVMVGLAGCNRVAARSDAQVVADVQDRIITDARVTSREITVQADHGVITLSGSVFTDQERTSAASDAATVAGVKTVVNNLQLQQAQATLPLAPEPAPLSPVPHASTPPVTSRAKTERIITGGLPKADPNSPDGSGSQQSAPPVEPATAQAAPPPPPPPPKKVTIPAGTQLTVRLNDGLDTERNQVGDSFHGSLGAPIVIDDQTVIPSGADVVGRVVDVKSAGRFAGNSALVLELNSLSVNGRTYNIQTNQWSRQGQGEGKNTAVKAGGGAAVGAIIGGLAGGGKGAAIGSVAGAGAGTGVAATKKGEQIKLAPESTLSFLLINTVTVIQQGADNRNAGRTPLQ